MAIIAYLKKEKKITAIASLFCVPNNDSDHKPLPE